MGTGSENIEIQVSLCYNSGKIAGYAGAGIIGYFGDKKSSCSLCYNKGRIEVSRVKGNIIGGMTADANVMKSFYWSGTGLEVGVGSINTPGDLNLQNSQAVKTDTNLDSYQQFLNWIKQYE